MHVCRSRLYDSAVYMDCRMPYFYYDLQWPSPLTGSLMVTQLSPSSSPLRIEWHVINFLHLFLTLVFFIQVCVVCIAKGTHCQICDSARLHRTLQITESRNDDLYVGPLYLGRGGGANWVWKSVMSMGPLRLFLRWIIKNYFVNVLSVNGVYI